MFTTKVDLSSVVAHVLWGTTVALLLAGTLVALDTDALGAAVAIIGHAIVCSAAAATATVRDLMFRQNRLMAEVFELGQKSTGVRQMRNH